MSVQPQSTASRRPYPLLAWLVILGVVVIIVQRVRTQAGERQQRISSRIDDFQERYFLGAALLSEKSREQAFEQAQRQYDRGPYLQRLRFVFLAAEVQGDTAAWDWLQHLKDLTASGELTPSRHEQQLTDRLARLYRPPVRPDQADQLTAEEKQELEDEFGWLARLALEQPNGPQREQLLRAATRTALVAQGVLFGAVCLCAVGLMLLYLVVRRKLRGQIQSTLSPPAGHGGLYIETVALWMLGYVGLSSLSSWIARPPAPILVSGVLMLSTLVVLAWPLLWGVSWGQLRKDLGWTTGKGPGKEMLVGLGTYVTALPVVLVGYLLLNALQTQFRRLTGGGEGLGPPPSHPAAEVLLGGSLWEQVQVILAAAVVAPIVEETLFRGLLYRHLREATYRLGPTLSVVLSGVISGLIFAAIHPQGLFVVPVLTILALAFALVREWRDSLVPSLVAHGINNGLVTLVLIGIAS
jgi:membrane protease YdiL (CAAX protease family)